jgi:hypothetical protein
LASRLHLQINRFDYPGSPAAIGPTLAQIARRAEAAGFSSIWAMVTGVTYCHPVVGR